MFVATKSHWQRSSFRKHEKNATYDGSKVLPTAVKTLRLEDMQSSLECNEKRQKRQRRWKPVMASDGQWRPVTFKVTALGARRYVRHTYDTEQGQVDNAVDRVRSLSPQSPVGQAVLPVLLAFDSSWTVSKRWSVLKCIEECWKMLKILILFEMCEIWFILK